MIARLLTLVALALLLCGSSCTKRIPPEGVCPVVPEVQLVAREVYVPMPAGILVPVTDPDPGKTKAGDTYGRAVKRADTRDTLLATCNARLGVAAELQGKALQ